MVSDERITNAAGLWACAHPAFASYIATLERHGVRPAVMASVAAHIAAGALGERYPRATNDIDMLVPPEHFGQAVELTPHARVVTRAVQFVNRRGEHVTCQVDEVTSVIGGDIIQFMHPRALAMYDGVARYNTVYPLHAARHRHIHAGIPLAHEVDVVAMYAILDRSHPKTDEYNARLVQAAFGPVQGRYAEIRAAEMGWFLPDDPVRRFIAATAPQELSATSPRARQPVARLGVAAAR